VQATVRVPRLIFRTLWPCCERAERDVGLHLTAATTKRDAWPLTSRDRNAGNETATQLITDSHSPPGTDGTQYSVDPESGRQHMGLASIITPWCSTGATDVECREVTDDALFVVV